MIRPRISPRGLFALLAALWSVAIHAAGMGFDDARHLLLRTGFNPTEAEVQAFAGLSRTQAVDRLLAEAEVAAHTPPPEWVDAPRLRLAGLKGLPVEERKALLKREFQRGVELRGWWYQEMLATPSPLTERMTLFWHNHFTSSQQKVKIAQLMYRQNVLLRRNALGNFGALLHAVAKDPAMLIYLDGVSNRRGRPNENFAREVMELFTLGVGHYTEQDVREAARAFTGWSLDRESGEFRFYPFLHDAGEKTVLGCTGRLDGDQVLDILLAQPATAEFVVTKLWREFVSPDPDPAEVARLADVFRRNGYEIRPLLRALFLSDAFYAAKNRATLVKSPVELLVGTARQFGIAGLDPRLFALAGRQLGQDVFGPPNVRGWPGGDDWINSNTLLARKQILARVFRGEEMPAPQGNAEAPMMRRAAPAVFDADAFFATLPGDGRARRAQAEKLVLAVPPTQPFAGGSRLDFIRHLALDPVYQLK